MSTMVLMRISMIATQIQTPCISPFKIHVTSSVKLCQRPRSYTVNIKVLTLFRTAAGLIAVIGN